MKRFYCTVCKKVKRVRKMPRVIETPKAQAPAERVGQCNRHKENYNATN
jgi:hypothetical protein